METRVVGEEGCEVRSGKTRKRDRAVGGPVGRAGLLMQGAQAEVGGTGGTEPEPRGRGLAREAGSTFTGCPRAARLGSVPSRLGAPDWPLKSSLLLSLGPGPRRGCDLVWGLGKEEGEKFPQVRRPRGRHLRGSCSLLSLTVMLVHKGGRKVRCGLSGPWEKLCPFP